MAGSLQQRIDRPTRKAVEDLRAQGYTMRDLAVLFQVREDQVEVLLKDSGSDESPA